MPDTTTPAGAMPVVAGAMPAQTPPAEPASTSAMGDDALGDSGKAALQQERDARKTAEREMKKLAERLAAAELAGKSEQEQAIAKAKAEGATEAISRAQAMVRRSAVREALAAAGCTDAALAARAEEFSDLEVDDDGEVKNLAKALKSFREAHPSLFGARRPSGSADGGAGSAGPGGLPTFTRAQLRDQTFFNANKDAILKAAKDGRIVG